MAPVTVLLSGSTGEHRVGLNCDLFVPQKDSFTYSSTKQGELHTLPQGAAKNERRRRPSRAHGPGWAALQLTVAPTVQNEYDRHHHDEQEMGTSRAFWRTSWKKLCVR